MFGTKNKYIRFIANSIVLIFLLFIFDLALGNLLRHLYFMAKSGKNYHLTYSLDSVKADIIILGSSRAYRHYVPKILEDSLALTCFNTGRDGDYMLTSFAVYKSITKRYTPQIILMEINPSEILVGTKGYDELNALLPYYKDKKEIRRIIELRSKFERLKLLSKIYPFNSALLSIIQSIVKDEDINELKGYQPFVGNLPFATLSYQREEIKDIDPQKINFLEELIFDCNTRHIRLIFIQSPRYTLVDQRTSLPILNKLAINYGVEFWNYVNDTMYLKPEYFKDNPHLNYLGAEKFTKSIASRIKREISSLSDYHNYPKLNDLPLN